MVQGCHGVNLSILEMTLKVKNSRLIVFAHQLGGSDHGFSYQRGTAEAQHDYLKLYKKLLTEGFDVMSFDFRNHGKSTNKKFEDALMHGWEDVTTINHHINDHKKYSHFKDVFYIGFGLGANAIIKA